MPGQHAYRQQMRVVASAGAVVALVLACAFALMLGVDRQSRLSLMQRQANLQAQSTQRLLQHQLDTTTRAMTSVQGQLLQLRQALGNNQLQPQVLEQVLEQTAARNPELVDLSVVDDSGQLLAGSRGDPNFYDWVVAGNLVTGSPLYIGPLQARSDNSWQLPLAMRIDAGRWLLLRLRGSQMQALVGNDQLGAGGVQLLLDRAGLVLADSRGPRLLGRQLGYWAQNVAQYPQTASGEEVFGDGVVRVLAVGEPGQLPLRVVTARARDEALVGWWRYLAGSLLIYLIYLLGVGYLLYAIRNAHLRQQRLPMNCAPARPNWPWPTRSAGSVPGRPTPRPCTGGTGRRRRLAWIRTRPAWAMCLNACTTWMWRWCGAAGSRPGAANSRWT